MNFITAMLKKISVDLLFTDTDSFVYEIGAKDVYEDIQTIHEIKSILVLLIKKLLIKWKMNSRGEWLVNLSD